MIINFAAATLVSLIFLIVSIRKYEEERWWFYVFYTAYAWLTAQAITYIPFVIAEWVLGVNIWDYL